jgi:hypothetical protein
MYIWGFHWQHLSRKFQVNLNAHHIVLPCLDVFAYDMCSPMFVSAIDVSARYIEILLAVNKVSRSDYGYRIHIWDCVCWTKVPKWNFENQKHSCHRIYCLILGGHCQMGMKRAFWEFHDPQVKIASKTPKKSILGFRVWGPPETLNIHQHTSK